MATVFVILLCLAFQAHNALADQGSSLSAEQAQAEATRYFPAAKAKLVTSRLIQPVEGGGHPSWSLMFDNGANALIDASTGKVTQFSSVPTQDTAQGNLTPTQAQDIARRLIAEMYPERVEYVKPDPVRPPQRSGAGIQVLFTRVANGALFPADGFQVNVNPNGSIGTFRTNWQDTVSFPAPGRVIGERGAIRTVLDVLTRNPRVFLFYQTVAPGQQPKLFYLVKTANAEMAIDAYTGVPAGGFQSPRPRQRDWGPILRAAALGGAWVLTVIAALLAGCRFRRSRVSQEAARVVGREEEEISTADRGES